MEESGTKQIGVPLLRWLLALALVLVTLHAALFLFWQNEEFVIVLPWFVPMIHSFMALAALSVAFLAFGRYTVLREAASFWIGAAFSTFAVFDLYYVLSWPGLLPNQQSLIAKSLNPVGWFWHLQFSALALLLLVSLLVPWPKADRNGHSWKSWLLVGLSVSILAGWLIVAFDQYLPLLVVGSRFTALNTGWSFGLLMAMAAGTLLAAQRYRRTGDTLFGWVALSELILTFAVLTSIIGGEFYDVWWYWQRVLWVAGLSAMLFGLLSEYVGLYRRERNYAAQLSATIDNMVEVVIVVDPARNIISVNQAARSVLGLKRKEDLLGSLEEASRLFQLRGLDGQPGQLENSPFVLALQGQSAVGQEGLLRRQDGTDIYFSMNTTPVRNPAGEIVMAVAVLRDVTELKRLERLREEFLATAAHELRTPVTSIKGYVQLMRRWTQEGREPREKQAIDRINEQCDRISRRVQEMLEVVSSRAAAPTLRLVSFDLGALAAEVLHRMDVIGHTQPVVLHRAGTVPVEADRERIDEVLVSLLSNAMKYSPEDAQVEMRVWASEDRALVSVHDNGVGISTERQPYIFEPFYEAVPPGAAGYHGVVALSLYLSKTTVERHGGRIWVDSREGKGSTFYFSLPLATSPAGAGQDDSSPTRGPSDQPAA